MAAPAQATSSAVVQQRAVIKYGCNCGRVYPIADLYYCQGCQRVLCKYCVTEEIESYFCPNCLENLASAEASMFSNRCKKCFQCPVCFCALNLSTVGNSEQVYLSCGFCRWNSLHLRLIGENPTKLVADINKLEREDPLQVDVSGLLDELRRNVKDQKRKEKFRHGGSRLRSEALRDSLSSIPSRTNSSSSAASNPSSSSAAPFSLAELEKRRAAQEYQLSFKGRSEQIAAKRTSLPSPASSSTTGTEQKEDFSETTTLEQRFSNLSTQPTETKALMPSRVELDTRRTKRCHDCDKLLIKPDLSPAKVEFKRHLVAMLYVPKLTLVPFSQWPLKAAPAKNAFVLCITNPLKTAMQVSLAQSATEGAAVTVSLPKDPLVVGPTDYVEGAEEEYEEAKKKDVATVVALRRGNKLYLHGVISTTESSPILQFSLRVQAKGTSALGPLELTFDSHFVIDALLK